MKKLTLYITALLAFGVLFTLNVITFQNSTTITLSGVEAVAQVVPGEEDPTSSGDCSTYTHCNNPYGSCFGFGGPSAPGSCLLYCQGGAWIYCDGA